MMKTKLNFVLKGWLYCCLPVLTALSMAFSAQAQVDPCVMPSIGQVNYSIQPIATNATCSSEIAYGDLGTFSPIGACAGVTDYQVQVQRGGVWQPAPNAASGTHTAALISSADIGKTYAVRVSQIIPDPNNAGAFVLGNSSWGYVTIQDKVAPLITCPLDATISCSQSTAPSATVGQLVASPNGAVPPAAGNYTDCSPATVNYTDYTFTAPCNAPFRVFPDVTTQGLPASIGTGRVLPAAVAGISKIIVRAWTAKDIYGNQSAPCYQVIYVTNPDVTAVVCPTAVLLYSCNSSDGNYITDLSPASIAAKSGNGAAYPVLAGTALIPSVALCNLVVTYSDVTAPLCGAGTFKVVRTWTVMDCNGKMTQCTQTISRISATPPAVTGSYSTYSTSGPLTVTNLTNTWNGKTVLGVATASTPVTLVALGSSNMCGGCATFNFVGSVGGCAPAGLTFTSSDSRFTASNVTATSASFSGCYMALGTYSVTFTAADACGNAVASQTYTITVVDNIKPNVVCISNTTVSLTTTGTVTAYAPSFDNGSTDNCGIDHFAVRRMTDCTGANVNSTFSDHVDFACCDANTNQMVVFRVYDVNGNYNDCMVNVLVQNKLTPTCIGPANTSIRCDSLSFLKNPNIANYDVAFGTASFYNNCGYTVVRDSSIQWSNQNCQVGTIVRHWTASDKSGNSTVCTQNITIRPLSDFTVDFPDDYITACVADPKVDANALKAQMLDPASWGKGLDGSILNNGCGVVGVEITDDTITSDPSYCFKIFRHITVIDWCKYNVNNDLTDFNANSYGQPVYGDFHGNANWQTVNQPAWQDLHALYAAPDPCPLPAADKHNYLSSMNPYNRRFRDADALRGDVIVESSPTFAYNIPLIDSFYNSLLQDNRKYFAYQGPAVGSPIPDICPVLHRYDGVLNFNSASGNNPTSNWSFSDGIMSYTQIIMVKDTIAPIFAAQADTIVCDLGALAVQGQSVCKGPFTYNLVATDGCASSSANVKLAWVITDQNGATILNGTGAAISTVLNYGVTYTVKASATDRCGNVSFTSFKVTEKDCKKPTIICKNVNAESMLMVNNVGAVTVWATDLLASPLSDNCTSQDNLNKRLVVSKHGAGFAAGATSITFTCTDYNAAPSHTVLVDLWTADDAGNADFCVAQIVLQDNLGICTANVHSVVATGVQTENLENVQSVAVTASNATSASLSTATTDQTGTASLSGLTTGTNVQISAARNDNPLNGVTTYDIALISKHILGIQSLNSPYKLIAADVNKDNTIDALDMLQLRKLILHITDNFTGNTSWRFIDKSYVFTNPANPFGEDFHEVVNISNLPAAAQANFVGVKVGDVNGSALPNGLLGSTAIRNKTTALTFNVDDVQLTPGQQYTVTFSADNFNAAGYQFTTNFTKGSVNVVGVNAAQLNNLSENNFGIFSNAITTSWNGSASGKLDAFTVTFTANTAAKLSDVLSIGSNLTTAEAYDANGNVMNVQLQFNTGKLSGNDFSLYQNEPNPASSYTNVGFNLPSASKATLTVYDVAGKVLVIKNGDFTQGYNTISLSKSELGASGVMYYRLDTPNNSATKKMVIIE